MEKGTQQNRKKTWTSDVTKNVILLYENYPCLYTVKSKDYHNKVKRVEALKDIRDNLEELHPTLSLTEEHIKTQIHGIRTQYMGELNIIKKSEASGAFLDSVYIPKLWCFEMLSFLNESANVVTAGESNLSLEVNQENSETEVELIFDGTIDELHQTLAGPRSDSRSDSRLSATSLEPIVKPREIGSHSGTPRTKKKKVDEQLENVLAETAKAINKMEKSDGLPEDDISAFCRYLFSEIKNIQCVEILDTLKGNLLSAVFKAKFEDRNKSNVCECFVPK